MFRASSSLIVIAATCAGLLTLTSSLTAERIEQNTRAHELRLITELAGSPPPASSTWAGDVWNLCNDLILARAEVSGYGGPVSLMIAASAIPHGYRLQRLRITSHQETPGLADFLEHPERGWLGELAGLSPAQLQEVDTVTGATITSRAIRSGVLAALARIQDPPVDRQPCKP